MFVTAILYLVYILYLYKLYDHYILHPGAVYYPAKPAIIQTILKYTTLKKSDCLVDLGSGDGRILFAFAQKGIACIGYEINRSLANKSRQSCKEKGLDKLVTIYNQSMYNSDLSKATIITLYQFPNVMKKLLRHIQKSITKPVTIVSIDYEFPSLVPFKTVNRIYYYHLDPLPL